MGVSSLDTSLHVGLKKSEDCCLDALRGTGLAGSVYKIVPFSINILPKKVISDSDQRETALQPRPDELAGGDCLVKLNDLVIKVSGLWDENRQTYRPLAT